MWKLDFTFAERNVYTCKFKHFSIFHTCKTYLILQTFSEYKEFNIVFFSYRTFLAEILHKPLMYLLLQQILLSISNQDKPRLLKSYWLTIVSQINNFTSYVSMLFLQLVQKNLKVLTGLIIHFSFPLPFLNSQFCFNNFKSWGRTYVWGRNPNLNVRKKIKWL